MKRTLWLVVVGAIVLGFLFLAFRPRPVDVDLASVTRGVLCVTVDEDGKTRIKERYVVSSPLAGRLLRIEMEPGDEVERGTSLLAVLEPRDPTLLDARELASARARVRAQDAALDRAKAEVERTRAPLEFAKSDLERTEKLAKKKAASKDVLERAILFNRQAQESFRAARFAEDMARYELELAQAALLVAQGDQPENAENSHFPIYSPITGRVLRVFQESATVVNAGAQLLEVGDPTDLEVEVDVPGVLITGIVEGDDADVTFDALPGRTFAGAVTEVGVSATGPGLTFPVTVRLAESVSDIRPGMAAEVGFQFESASQRVVYLLPAAAVGEDREGRFVFVVQPTEAGLGIIERRPVSVGELTAEGLEVIEGLVDGDRVVTAGWIKIEPGLTVRLSESGS